MMYCGVDEAFNSQINNNKPPTELQTEQIQQIQAEFKSEENPFKHNICDDSLSFLDAQSVFTDNSVNSKYTVKRSHNYYIKKFMAGFIDDGSLSLGSVHDNDMYDHVKECKYCRSQISKKMKKHYSSLNSKTEPFTTTVASAICGYNFNEILIITLFGIILIFILDLFVKIGK